MQVFKDKLYNVQCFYNRFFKILQESLGGFERKLQCCVLGSHFTGLELSQTHSTETDGAFSSQFVQICYLYRMS